MDTNGQEDIVDDGASGRAEAIYNDYLQRDDSVYGDQPDADQDDEGLETEDDDDEFLHVNDTLTNNDEDGVITTAHARDSLQTLVKMKIASKHASMDPHAVRRIVTPHDSEPEGSNDTTEVDMNEQVMFLPEPKHNDDKHRTLFGVGSDIKFEAPPSPDLPREHWKSAHALFKKDVDDTDSEPASLSSEDSLEVRDAVAVQNHIVDVPVIIESIRPSMNVADGPLSMAAASQLQEEQLLERLLLEQKNQEVSAVQIVVEDETNSKQPAKGASSEIKFGRRRSHTISSSAAAQIAVAELRAEHSATPTIALVGAATALGADVTKSFSDRSLAIPRSKTKAEEFATSQETAFERRNEQKTFDNLGTGLLSDIDTVGFSAVLMNPVSRLYFLMFLLEHGRQSLLLCFIDLENYNKSAAKMNSSQKHNAAQRIYQMYLSNNAKFGIAQRLLTDLHETDLIESVLRSTATAISNAGANTFKELTTIILNLLSKNYGDKSDKDQTNFFNSVHYQSMCSDYQDLIFLSKSHAQRAIERVLDFPYELSRDYFLKIKVLFDEIKVVDWEKLTHANRIGSDLSAVLSPRRTKTTSGYDSLGELSKSASAQESLDSVISSPQVPRNARLRSLRETTTVKVPTSAVDQHPFIRVANNMTNVHCQFCFKDFSAETVEIHGFANKCEACNYVCHKNCRNLIGVSCLNLAKSKPAEDNTQPALSRAIQYLERYEALTKELQVSENIKKGMERMEKAKSEMLSSIKSKDGKRGEKGPASLIRPMAAEISQVDSKINFLQRDLDNCKVALANVLASISSDVLSLDNPELKSVKVTLQEILGDLQAFTQIRVILPESQGSQMQARKTFAISNSMSTREVMEVILSKSNVDHDVADASVYFLSYEDKAGVTRTLEENARPATIAHLLKDCSFYLQKISISCPVLPRTAEELASRSGDEAKVQEKRINVCLEIIDTEIAFVDKLAMAIRFFMLPISNSGIVAKPDVYSIFSNIKDVVNTHTKIAAQMKKAKEADPKFLGVFAKVYDDFGDSFAQIYTTYCGNQHTAQRTLAKMKDNSEFAKFLKQCQNRPQLAKFSLGDILILPMHRITRLPLLLKRLLSYTPMSHADFPFLVSAIGKLEAAATSVNVLVSKKENEFRIKYLQQNMDWNGVSDPFVIATDKRILLSEKPFTYTPAMPTSNRKQVTEVTTFLFDDMLLVASVEHKKDDLEFLTLRHLMPFRNLSIFDVPKKFIEKSKSQEEVFVLSSHAFQIVNSDSDYCTLEAVSNTDKTVWMLAAQKKVHEFCHDRFCAIKDYYFDVETLRERPEKGKSGSATPNIFASLLSLNTAAAPSSSTRSSTETLPHAGMGPQNSILFSSSGQLPRATDDPKSLSSPAHSLNRTGSKRLKGAAAAVKDFLARSNRDLSPLPGASPTLERKSTDKTKTSAAAAAPITKSAKTSESAQTRE